ncbi:MAG TPA: hypothetical protein VHE61_12260, partial [Opitutaceae bacterium]|nr:hypothetical protein [Opitutaceae bacterium]
MVPAVLRRSEVGQRGQSRGWRFAVALVAGCGLLRAAEPAGADKPAAQPAQTDASCLDCHSDNTLTMTRDGKKVSLAVDPKALAGSAHASLACVDCHEKFDGDASPHRTPMVRVDCTGCHDDAGRKHAFHPRLTGSAIPAGHDTSCTECHGTHAVVPLKSKAFPFADG